MSLVQIALQEIAEMGFEIYTELESHYDGAFFTCEGRDDTGWNMFYIYPDGQWHYDA